MNIWQWKQRQTDKNLIDIFLDVYLPETVPDNRLALSKKGFWVSQNNDLMDGFEGLEIAKYAFHQIFP